MSDEIEREFVALVSATSSRNGAGFNPGQGLYRRPAGKRPTVAAIATHYNVDFSEHYLGEYLTARSGGCGLRRADRQFRGRLVDGGLPVPGDAARHQACVWIASALSRAASAGL
jgi:hypothetical protein